MKIGHALMIGETAFEASGLVDDSWREKLREAREIVLLEELRREQLSSPNVKDEPRRDLA